MASIVQKFNPRDREHVAWLKELGEGMAKVTNGDNCDIIYLMTHNPMNEIFTDFMQFAYIHFQLAMKYTNAVLSKDAFIP
jgi:hypothetical protein